MFYLTSSSVQAEELSFFFKDTYEDSRAQFLKNAESLKTQVPNLQLRSLKIPSAKSEELFTDVLYVPPPDADKDRLLILVSGIHGMEGFVGSALQNMFLQKNFFEARNQGFGVLLVHALNPYGFKFHRRVSENNIDLNRNFDINNSLFELKNDGYQSVRDLLNPTDSVGSGTLDRVKFYIQCVVAIAKYSMDSLRRAILKGQYEVPEGIYFGGNKFEPQKDLLEKELLEFSNGYKKILLIDLHTGYGQRGKLHLFADRSPALDASYLEKIFAGQGLDYGQKKNFYEATGGLVVYAAKLFQNKARYAGMVFEFGTLDSQKTLGSLDSLYRMVRENQHTHHGAHSPQDAQQIQHLFSEMFYPQDSQWRIDSAHQFEKALASALQKQKELK
ncbi:M14 family metallopeptidase [Bdellovibrio sp. HCB337]|uniref:M14 family metallopeptidase n=1 Tax=Bdellovibrio sp. HCB337 TaxID=3394358 RepID=UPI0039A787B8